MGELLVLDPAEVAEDRVEVDLTTFVGPDGPDFGDAAIEAAMAQAGKYGQSPVDFTIPNRTITIPLALIERNGTSFEDIRRKVQAKAALFQREGGWIKRETALGTVYADVVNATVKLGAKNLAAWGYADVDAVLTLECLPDWYGDEVTLDAITETTAAEVASVLKQDGTDAVIQGDYPARCRIVCDEGENADQLAALWGVRSRHYDAAPTAALAYEAEALTPLDTAAVATVAGASGGASNNVVAHTNLLPTWLSVLSTEIAASGDMTHVGSFRVWARVRSPDGSNVRVRFVWDVGDITLPVANDPWLVPATADSQPVGSKPFYIADLGEIRIDRAPYGTHRWRGHVQAEGAVGGEELQIDKIWLQPVDEGAGRLGTAAAGASVPAANALSARDEFNSGGGFLTGQTLQIGGTWAGAGDADDFQVTTAHAARRSVINDVSEDAGRYALAGTSAFTNIVVRVDVNAAVATSAAIQGVLARYTDTSKYLRVGLRNNPDTDERLLSLRKRTSEGDSERNAFAGTFEVDQFYTIQLAVLATGRYFVWVNEQGSAPALVLDGFDPDLAAGGELASGRVGMFDFENSASANIRDYDNFAAWVPDFDAVLFANQAAELRTEGMYRLDSTGTAPGPMSRVIGDLPRLPPSGLENRPAELFVKLSRGDLDDLPDMGIDDIAVQVHYRPCWLFVPDDGAGA